MTCNGINNRRIMKHSSTGIIIALLILLLFAVSSCSKRRDMDEVFFRVDEELIGETFSDSLLAISIGVPVGWDDITGQLEEVVARMFEESDSIEEQGLSFRKAYGDLEDVAFMLICEFNYKHIHEERDSAIEAFLSYFAEETEVLKIGSYRHNELSFHQLTSREENLINIKLLVYGEAGAVSALDYFIPETKYMDYIERIESSIGSISKQQ